MNASLVNGMSQFKGSLRVDSDMHNNEQKTLVSVIVPSRQEVAYIGNCLKALIRQTYGLENLEIIVVDGMSADGTREIIAEYARLHKEIKLFDNKLKTTPIAMNIGIKQAKGTYIARVDAHTKPSDNFIEQCVKVINSTDAEVVGGPIETIGEGFWGKQIAYVLSSVFGVGQSFRTMDSCSGYVDTLAFGLYKREVLEKAGPHDEKLTRGQDWDINQRIIANGGRIYLDSSIRSVWYCANNPIKFIIKSFLDGYWIAAIFEKRSFRHLAPFFYLLSFVGLALVCYWRRHGLGPWRYVYFPFWSYALLYVMVAFFYSLGMAKRTGWHAVIVGPFLYASFHFSRGLGTLYGLLSGMWLKY